MRTSAWLVVCALIVGCSNGYVHYKDRDADILAADLLRRWAHEYPRVAEALAESLNDDRLTYGEYEKLEAMTAVERAREGLKPESEQ